MTRIPPHSGKAMVAALERLGLRVDRQKGSHVVMVRQGLARPVVVPQYDELPDFIVSRILRTAGVSRKSYLAVLKKKRP